MLLRTPARRFSKIAVFGGGTMGGGIAQVSAAYGIPVTVIETTDELSAKSAKVIDDSLKRVAKKMAETKVVGHEDYVERVTSKLTFASAGAKADEAVQGADLVIEAIVEDIEVKKALWSRVDGIANKDCVFASNTSSLSIASQAAVTKRPDKFFGLHFFSPVVLMKLVEIVKTPETSEDVVKRGLDYCKLIGKEPVVCADTKGFIVNRLLVPLMLEAARMVERGDATKEDVDKAMRFGAGHPMGPFTLCDSIGVDVVAKINKSWHEEFPNDPLFNEVKLISDTAKDGKLGRKAGEGFYKYSKK